MSLFDQDDEYRPPDDKNRLFETQERNRRSAGQYLRIFFVIALLVVILGAIVGYFTLPGIGDRIKPPDGLAEDVISHFTDIEKRSVIDTATFKCDGFYWVRVEVEPRPDVPGDPLNSIAAFRAKVVPGSGGKWDIQTKPIAVNSDDVPCRF